MRLILVRHGETVENIDHVVQGQTTHGNLSEEGKLQVKKLGERLKDEKIDVIFSSDLQRAKDTAMEIHKFHKIPTYFKKELRELSRGIFEGKKETKEYFIHRKKAFKNHAYRFPKGESVTDVRKRIADFLEMLHQNYSDKDVVLVSHGTFLSILINFLQEKMVDLDTYKLKNASISIIEFDEDKNHKFHLIDDTSHLA